MTDEQAHFDKGSDVLPGGHVLYRCTTDHNLDEYPQNCMFCDGGLTACSVCDAFEGAWTTDCPGVPVTAELWELVYSGRRDFVRGKGGWVDAGSPHSPEGRRRLEFEIQRLTQRMGWDHVEFFAGPPSEDPPLNHYRGGYEASIAEPGSPQPPWWTPREIV